MLVDNQSNKKKKKEKRKRKKERIQKFKETGEQRTGDAKFIYRNKLDKACFQHDMAYGYFKDLAKRTASDKVLRNNTFNIAKNLKHDGYKRGLAPMVYKFFDKKTASGGAIKFMLNQKVTDKLHEVIIQKL